MTNILLVPVHLHALVLDRDQMVVETTADFSRLPFCTGKRDINPDIANISEEIVSKPFQNENLLLKKGIHLHWSLPDALTRARPNPDSPGTQDFPRVPNRWLVTRCNSSGGVEKEWLIESDFLFPTLEGSLAGNGVPMPYRKDQRQPFRYMGRRVEWSDPNRNKGEYYPKLTAVGYGEPSFAAFYPNCFSVFGFFDDEYSGSNDGRQYYVSGWYSDVKEDVLRTHVRDVLLFRSSDFTNLASLAVKLRDRADSLTQYLHNQLINARVQLSAYTGAGDPPEALRKLLIDDLNRVLKAGTGDLYKPERFTRVTPETLALVQKRLLGHEEVYVNRKLLEEAFPEEIAPRSPTLPSILEDSFRWTLDQSGVEFPMRMVCYARLVLGQPMLRAPHGPTTVAIGNTGTEALSACMAQSFHGNAPKRIVEDHLEALHLAPTLEHRQLDVAAKFDEGRHEKGFAAVSGGILWTVQAETTSDSPAEARGASKGMALPEKLGRLLNTLNERQSKYDREWQAIESLRIQLFSDWYKYMLCAYPPEGTRDAYPDIDKVAGYVERRVEELNDRIAKAGTLALNETGGRVVAQASSAGGDSTLASSLAKAINELQTLLDSQNRIPPFRLKQTSGPRYWRPTEPSVLIEGTIADPSNRHGQDGRPTDGLLETQILSSTIWPTELTETSLRLIREGIARIGGRPGKNFAFTTWDGQPWNPFLLEWEVEVFPVEHKSNIDPSTGRYHEDFITANYQLVENDVDLSLRPGRGAWTMAANVYSGRSILTPHAGEQLGKQAQSYIQRQVLPLYYKEANVLRSKQGTDDLESVIRAAQTWYETSAKSPLLRAAKKDEDPNMTAFRAWGAMRDPDVLSQSLSGFNDALLMHKQTLQLHVADPLGFDDYQPFATGVGTTISNSIYNAPEPLNDFNPLRSGMMKIHRLRIIDTFGQVKDLDVKNILPSETLDDGTEDPLINLPPRLMQPARVNFRWLSAEANQEEMNDHPATSPICGWVLANHFDHSLMIYDNSGKALGSLVRRDTKVEWLLAPGADAPSKISNPHLNKMVTTILDWGADFLDDFLSAIDSAVENIEPENFARHQDLALLMGRPLALVRASVNLELKGLPVTHQGWNEFRQDLERKDRDDNGFTRVRFPIRIGEYRQFNDGTVGYWKEKDDGYEDKVFFAPQSDADVKFKCAHLKTHRTDPEAMVFFQTVESAPQILSLLIDPRGLVHATTGVLPVKAINIPPDQYAAALQAIELTFLSAPVLTDSGKIHLPLPEEAGYQWSWLQKNFDSEWSEVSSRGLVRKETFVDAFNIDAETIWKDLKDQGWIELIDQNDETRASVTAKDDRKSPELSPSLKDKTDKIEDILDRAHIGAVDPSARFSGPQEIREGWLKLSPAAAPKRRNN